jgi:hypothetical protein
MRPQSAKAKGRRKQQEIADILRSFLCLDETDIKSLPMGSPGIDLWMSAAAIEKLPISFEVKCQESLNIWSALEQAERNNLPHTLPALVFSRNRSSNYIAMGFLDFLQLIKRINVTKEQP